MSVAFFCLVNQDTILLVFSRRREH